MSPNATIRGHVLDARTGQGIVGARVFVARRLVYWTARWEAAAVSGADGAPGYRAQVHRQAVPPSAAIEVDLRIRPGPGHCVCGSVTAEDGRPVADVPVRPDPALNLYWFPNPGPNDEQRAHQRPQPEWNPVVGCEVLTLTDDAGQFQVAGLPAGQLAATVVDGDRWCSPELRSEVPSERVLRLGVVRPGTVVVSRRSDPSGPSPNVWLQGRQRGLPFEGYVARGDASGVCRLTGVVPGPYLLRVALHGGAVGAWADVTRELTVEPGGHHAVALDDAPTGEIDVTVLHVDGRPAADVRLWLLHPAHGKRAGVTTADGRVRFSGLAPGRYALGLSRSAERRLRTVTLADEPAVVTVVVPDRSPLSVRVLGPDGQPVPFVSVRVDSPMSDEIHRQRADDRGVVSFPDVLWGLVGIEIEGADQPPHLALHEGSPIAIPLDPRKSAE